MIILHPGTIISFEDGDHHFIGVTALMRLYGVARTRGHEWMSDDSLLYQHRMPDPNDWHLYPRANGNYFQIPEGEAGYYMPAGHAPDPTHNDLSFENRQGETEWQDHGQVQGGYVGVVEGEVATPLSLLGGITLPNFRTLPDMVVNSQFREAFQDLASHLNAGILNAQPSRRRTIQS